MNCVKIIPLIVLAYFMSLCTTHDPLAEDRKKAEQQICNDIKKTSHSACNALTMGIGSAVLSFVLSEKEQDSLILKPLLPYIRKELKLKNKQQLNKITSNTNERVLFLSSLLIKNKDFLIHQISSSFKLAEPLINKSIELINSNSIKIEK
jgi:hypothetical protein